MENSVVLSQENVHSYIGAPVIKILEKYHWEQFPIQFRGFAKCKTELGHIERVLYHTGHRAEPN